MFSHTKSLVALGLAIVLAICAWYWFAHQAGDVISLSVEEKELEGKISEGAMNAAIVGNMEDRIALVKTNISAITRQFSGPDNTGPSLVAAVVKTASLSGLETISTVQSDFRRKNERFEVPASLGITRTSYEFAFKGAYAGVVKFLQLLESDKTVHRIESVDITGLDGSRSNAQVQVSVVISTFGYDKRKASSRTVVSR
jgi:Tfp pilus assembly protein PilO